jgi:poly(3-hydroxybutyrate) depolymerase
MPVRSWSKQCLLTAAIGACLAAPGLAGATDAPVALPAYNANLSQTSVSGLSSGAFMAAQFSVAYSSLVVGAGIVAGGPFYCAGEFGNVFYNVNLMTAMTVCMNPAASFVSPPSASALMTSAKGFAAAGDIDPLTNLRKQKIYLFSGTKDTTVTTNVVDQAKRFYGLAGVPGDQIVYVNNQPAGHALITDKQADQACSLTATPYINDCHVPQAQDILEHIYGPLNPKSGTLSGKIVAFNQASFRGPNASMSDTAYVYVPAACASQSCRVHVAFHGCEQDEEAVGDAFYNGAGYNEVADANNIIVLYPQAAVSLMNPKGCWDFWGYTNPAAPDFYKKTATQMATVKAMLDRLASARTAR